MQVKKSTNLTLPLILTVIGCGTISFLSPIFLALSPAVFALSKSLMGSQVDELTEEDTEKIVEKAREQGVRSVTVKQTMYSEGALFKVPMTRKYRVTFDD